MNEATYSPKEAWPFVNYLDTGSITDNRIKVIQYLELSKDNLPVRARRKVEPDDIVFSTVRPNQRHFGLLRGIPENFLASTGFAVIRARENVVDPGFLYWFLTQDQIVSQLHTVAEHSTSAYPSIRPADIEGLEVNLPPVSEQRAIAHILGTLDDKIELNRRMNETLEAMARAIFKDWFVDFGPVRARAAGRAPYLAPELWDLFPDALDNDNKPSGWKVSPVGERIEILDAKRIPLSSRERKQRQGPYPYHGAAGVMDYVDDFLFEGVHILLGEDGSVVNSDGKPFTQYVWGQFWVNNHAHVLRGKDISNEMLLCFLQQADIAPHVTGAVQPKLNQRNLRSIPFSASDFDAAAAFGRVVRPLFDQLRLNAEESRILTQTRDLLLPKLISGEIRIPETGKIVEAMA